MAPLTNKSILHILLGTLVVIAMLSSHGKAQFTPLKVRVEIINSLTQPQDLTLHCKDKHHDLGEHTLRTGEMYSFKFKPNFIVKATLYFCGFRWSSDPSLHHFDIYDERRDYCSRCTWKIMETGACTYDPSKAMLGFTSLSKPSISIPLPSSSNFFPLSSSLTLKIQPWIPRKPIRFVAFADSNNGLNEQKQEDKAEEQVSPNGVNGDDSSSKDRRPIFNFNLGSLLDPDPDNLLALALTGLLTWASVQVLWQLFFISLAILVAALKYSFIAALLLFILITLL
ncbi:S-protein-like protein 5-like [Senna tora]|uniref:S-protein-like protein 5-like n=1 Tax=Senna tora TaxID=362788 RepID=A0A834WEF9_9FABA|nr:S-protein-like protein 5-like [Senna tora]